MSLINQPASFRPSWSIGDQICTPLLGRAGGRQAEMYNQVCREGAHGEAPESGSWGILCEAGDPDQASLTRFPRLRKAAAVCLREDWRLEPQEGSWAGGLW